MQDAHLFDRVVAALDLLAGLDGADGDADRDHDHRKVFGRFVAAAKVIHPSQHVGNQGSLKKIKQKTVQDEL